MKTMLITGASSGIGKELALAAGSEEWNVIACGRNEERLAELAHGSEHIQTRAFDLTDPQACERMLGDVSPDVVVLNAGNCEYVDVDDFNTALFRRVFEANFFSATHCIEVLLPRLKAGSQLVLVDSMARLLPFTQSEAYGASKAALHYMTRCIDVDLRPRGITVQSISPGFVKTPLTEKNTFSMPMQVQASEAARAILKSIQRRERAGYFPSVFAAIVRSLALLPSAVQVAICRRLARQQEALS